MVQKTEVPEVTIRDLTMQDYDSVLRLWVDAGLPFRPLGRDRPERVSTELRRGTAVFLVAESGGEVVGVVLGTHDGRKGWINRLAVAPGFQRRGIARRLVGQVEERLATLGLEITAALIESPNQASLKFFQEIGYTRDPEIAYVSRRRSPDT